MTAERPRPPLLLRIYASLVFPFAAEGSLVWWWRMHRNLHDVDSRGRPDSHCPYCQEPTDDR